MICGFRKVSGRAFCLLTILGLLAATAPGCGETTKTEEGPSTVPANVQESNKNMENFMKNQGAK